jgi:replicative DNA helicase Mcm
LVSRFDIIWLLTDSPETEKDAKIAHHIINNRLQGISELLVHEGSAPDPTKTSTRTGVEKTSEHDEVLSRDLIRKYIAYSKRTVHPLLEQDARDAIVNFYVETRKQIGDSNDSVAITARSLEALARLAEASARIRLSQVATLDDAQRAIRMTRLWREDLMGGNFDETTLVTGKKGTVRNREKAIMEIVASLAANNGGVAQLVDVFNEAERYDIDRATAEDVIDKLCQHGRMLRPSGYETLQIA